MEPGRPTHLDGGDFSADAMRLDPRVERTRQALRAALLDLAQQGPLSGLSVAAVTRQAGVTRQTFYDHYRDLDELAVDALRTELQGLREVARLTGELLASPTDPTPPAGLQRLTGFLFEHRHLLRGMLGPAGSPGFAAWLRERLTADVRESLELQPAASRVGGVDVEVQADFLCGAMLGVIVPRLLTEPTRQPEEVAAQLWALLRRQGPTAREEEHR